MNEADVDVRYWLTESVDEAFERSAVSLLSADERVRHGRFVFGEDRRDFSAAHALLRRVLSRYAGVPPAALTFLVEGYGKPLLAPSGIEKRPIGFNLSHTRGLVACVVARGADVGVDVECVDRATDDREIARRFFSPSERADLDACDAESRSARFIDLWTLKEAYLKATGQGLSGTLDEISFTFNGSSDLTFTAEPDACSWTFALFTPSARTRLAVAIRSSQPTRWRIHARVEGDDLSTLAPVRRTDVR